jgi:hypothetical protein
VPWPCARLGTPASPSPTPSVAIDVEVCNLVADAGPEGLNLPRRLLRSLLSSCGTTSSGVAAHLAVGDEEHPQGLSVPHPKGCVHHHSWPFRSLVCRHHFSRHVGGNKTRADTWIRLCVATSHWRHGIVSDNKPISGRETG